MARLSTATSAAKYNVTVLDLLSRSMTKGVPITAGKGRYVLANTQANCLKAEKYIKFVGANKQTDAMKLTFDTIDKRIMVIGAVDKAQLKGEAGAGTPKGNKGDVGEGILAAAIVARFTNKNKPVTHAMVVNVIKKLAKRPSLPAGKSIKKILTLKSLNEDKFTVDQIECTCVLAKINMDAVLHKDSPTTYATIFKAAVTYANNGIIREWANKLYCNNQENIIQVQALGTLDQTGTKVDIGVLVDGKKTDINISLKVEDTKQFGQVGGAQFEKMEEMFGGLDINLAGIEKKYRKLLAAKRVNEALKLAYTTAKDQIDARCCDVRLRRKFIKKFGEFISFHATRHEENVTLVQLGRRDVHVYSFDDFQNAFASLEIRARVIDSAGKPTILLESGGKELIRLRARIENKPKGPYVRNLVEKGPLFTDLLAQHYV